MSSTFCMSSRLRLCTVNNVCSRFGLLLLCNLGLFVLQPCVQSRFAEDGDLSLSLSLSLSSSLPLFLSFSTAILIIDSLSRKLFFATTQHQKIRCEIIVFPFRSLDLNLLHWTFLWISERWHLDSLRYTYTSCTCFFLYKCTNICS